jgi:hypothetical protein
MSESNTNNASEQSEDPIEEVKQDNIKAAKKQKLKADSDRYMGTGHRHTAMSHDFIQIRNIRSDGMLGPLGRACP